VSRAGRASGPAAKKRELHARLRTAVAEHQATEAPAAPVELPPEVAVQFRAQRLYGLCKAEIVRHYPPLWPPEAVGMNIAEQWLQNLARRMQENAVEQMRARAVEAGIALPS
jgi:hypothetical protein